ncbi:hypothetical protein ACV34X_30490, partial [Pseudomonas aeruginosa]
RRRGAACVRSGRGRGGRTADGGALGAALLEACLRQGWLRPQDGSRALQVSSKGRAVLRGLARGETRYFKPKAFQPAANL